MEGRLEVRLGVPSTEKEHQGMFVTSATTASRKEYIEEWVILAALWSIQGYLSYLGEIPSSKWYLRQEEDDDEEGPSSSRMIEGPGGLRLVVTVEKEDLRGSGGGGEEEQIEKETGKDICANIDLAGMKRLLYLFYIEIHKLWSCHWRNEHYGHEWRVYRRWNDNARGRGWDEWSVKFLSKMYAVFWENGICYEWSNVKINTCSASRSFSSSSTSDRSTREFRWWTI